MLQYKCIYFLHYVRKRKETKVLFGKKMLAEPDAAKHCGTPIVSGLKVSVGFL